MKELVISDIDFVNPEKDTTYYKNIIRNLLGNYFLSTKNNKYLWTTTNNAGEKGSLIDSEDDASLSSIVQSNKEIVTILFALDEWNKNKASDALLKTLEDNINKLLSDSYYYGLANSKNNLSNPNSDEEKLLKQYGEYFYDYSIVMPTPTIIPQQVSQEYVDSNLTTFSTAKIQPLYNFYDKEFEQVASASKESSLYNFYALYYYLLENLDDKTKDEFLQKNVLPLLKKYDSYANTYLSQDVLKELQKFKKTDTSPEANKKTIIVHPDSLKLINDLDSRKAEQPYGIDISFEPLPKKAIATLLGNTSEMADLEKFVVDYQNPNVVLNNRNFIAELVYSNENKLTAKNYYKVPFISLNNWIESLEPIKNNSEAKDSLIFTKKLKDKDSVFLKKIKKTLLQKKITSLIEENKRTFSELIAGASAYNEVMLYEIKKYDSNYKQLQSILIPNTEDLDFYKYFDTQVKYDTKYKYEVLAWTLIIGNRYKYFDRLAVPPKKKIPIKLKNNSSDDSEYFRWLRIAQIFSNLQVTGGIFSLVQDNKELFGGSSTDPINYVNSINFSRVLQKSYNPNGFPDILYKPLLNNESSFEATKKLLEQIAQNFASTFVNMLLKAQIQLGTDVSFSEIIYQTFNQPTVDYPTDLLDTLNINPSNPYYSVNSDFTELQYTYNILNLFIKSGILSDKFNLAFVDSQVQKYKTITTSKKFIIKTDLINYFKGNFVKDVNLFLDGGFITESKEIDLKKEPNYNLNKNDKYYPRFYTKKDSSNIISGQLQFGILNEADVVLAGLPYANSFDFVSVISSPPPPPEVAVIPYKGVDKRIKFFLTDSPFTYREEPIYMLDSDFAIFSKALENEKIKNNDGKITFKGDEPSIIYVGYRLDTKPKDYKDFAKAKIIIINPKGGGFDDTIEPNSKYYYTFRSADSHNMFSNPSPIYEVEVVNNSGAIYPIINVYDIVKEDTRIKSIAIKEKFKIDVNKEHILLKDGVQVNSALDISQQNNFGSKTPSLFGRKFKIRITSKSSKKKLDVNLSFEKTTDFSLVLSILKEKKEKAIQKIKPKI